MDLIPREDQTHRGFAIAPDPVSWALAVSAIVLGVLMMASPKWWFGPSWAYFPLLHLTLWLGVIWTLLGWHEVILLYLKTRINVLAYLFMFGGATFATGGLVLFVAGYEGRQGLWEAPYMCVYGALKLAHSISLLGAYRKEMVAIQLASLDDEVRLVGSADDV